jgi:hypothetical protein
VARVTVVLQYAIDSGLLWRLAHRVAKPMAAGSGDVIEQPGSLSKGLVGSTSATRASAEGLFPFNAHQPLEAASTRRVVHRRSSVHEVSGCLDEPESMCRANYPSVRQQQTSRSRSARGSSGSTGDASTGSSHTALQLKSKRPTTLVILTPRWRDRPKRKSLRQTQAGSHRVPSSHDTSEAWRAARWDGLDLAIVDGHAGMMGPWQGVACLDATARPLRRSRCLAR